MYVYVDYITDIIKLFIIVVLSTQFAYGCTILLLERTMLDYYDLAVYRPATTNFQKFTNAFQKGMFGSGDYIYTKIGKYNWFVRKILYLLSLLVQGVLSIIIYYILAWLVDLIFGLII